MSSGQQGPQGQYPGWQQPVYQPPHRAASDYMRMFVGDMFLAIAVALGLFLMWLGSLIAGTADTQGGYDWGAAVKGLGMLAVTLAFYLGAMVRQDLDKNVRALMLLCGTLLIIFVGYWSGLWMF